MRIKAIKTNGGRLLYVIRTYYDAHGKEHTLTVEKLGNENDIRENYGRDPDEWAKEHVAELNRQEKEANQAVEVLFQPSKRIASGKVNTFHVGYLFLQSLYYEMKLDKICKKISDKHKFEYDLNSILSRLLYGRVIEPYSKRSTYKFSKTLIEKPNFEGHHIYRALDVLWEGSDYIQSAVYQNSFAMGKRHTGVIYYDCTNYFFEMEHAEDDTLPQFGKSKESRPLPIVEMGLFMDSDGIPLSFCIHPSNTNERVTLKPAEQKLISEFGMSKIVACTDAGLASKANRRFNNVQNRAYITTQSIKELKNELKEWALDSKGWQLLGDRKITKYDLSCIDESKYQTATFYKERLVDCGNYEENFIITYSLKYRNYQRTIREEQVSRAVKAIANGSSKLKTHNQNDYRRFVEKIATAEDGIVAENETYILDQARIAQEAKYDGFYGVTTNLEDTPEAMVRVNQQRWQIEECFKIMKSEFKARPVHHKNDIRIEAHFLTCVLALILFRYLEKKLGNKYTCEEIIKTLKGMKMREVLGKGYIPSYTRTDITDALHEAFGFETDRDIITNDEMKRIVSKTKKKIAYQK